MGFNPREHDIENWLRLEDDNILQKICDLFDGDGRLVERRKTRIGIYPAGRHNPLTGAPSVNPACIRRIYFYDEFDNITVSVPSVAEWTQACEDIANGEQPDNPSVPTVVPRGLLLAPLNIEYNEVTNVTEGVETLITRITVQPDERLYIRHADVSGENRAIYTLKIDGDIKYKKRTWWTRFDSTILSNTADGGIIVGEGSTISVYVTNTGEGLANFNATIGYVRRLV